MAHVRLDRFGGKVQPGSDLAVGLASALGPDQAIKRDLDKARQLMADAGYADGFNRLFSNHGRVLISGHSYPIVGRVCMDQSMVNLGPNTDVSVGDEVVLIGSSGNEEISAYEWADKLNTITYEVTSQINHRVPRIFDPF